jgi:hypothetical protein
MDVCVVAIPSDYAGYARFRGQLLPLFVLNQNLVPARVPTLFV